MKPAYWIAILALVGGIIGYGVFHATGWSGTILGVVLGILVGAVIYAGQARRTR
ncbi:MAG: hypothetical protein M1281_00835 [Chloroflexi bacterium]|nr:hypothetical protein [Chloroflexota bacterium]